MRNPPTNIDPRTSLAAERTLLAWIRTGLAMMGFGFVVARFGLFLRQLATIRHHQSAPHGRFSLWIGIGLVAVGVATTVFAAVRHQRIIGRIARGEPLATSRIGLAFASVLAMIGLVMAAYLLAAQEAD